MGLTFTTAMTFAQDISWGTEPLTAMKHATRAMWQGGIPDVDASATVVRVHQMMIIFEQRSLLI